MIKTADSIMIAHNTEAKIKKCGVSVRVPPKQICNTTKLEPVRSILLVDLNLGMEVISHFTWENLVNLALALEAVDSNGNLLQETQYTRS